MDEPSSPEVEKCKWYYRPFWVWVIILSVGPLALPFLIFSPKFSKVSKTIISLVLIGFTVYLCYFCFRVYQILNNPDELRSLLQNYVTPEQMKLVETYLQNI